MSNIFKGILIVVCASVVWAVQSEGLHPKSDKNAVSSEQQKAIEQEILKVHAEMVKAAVRAVVRQMKQKLKGSHLKKR